MKYLSGVCRVSIRSVWQGVRVCTNSPASAATNTVTWTPTLTATETLDIYAKWTSEANRANDVTYTVHHAGGSTPIVVNQKQNGGTWHHLGRFSFAPSSNHRITVADSPSGVVVADAVRFVSAGVGGGTGLLYVHADHLGTPQKMTDGNQALVWDAVYKPFGESHSITGTASNQQRFPGQYADAETSFSYNYFRDYDPSTGRYVESNPIGLMGGMNTFGYVTSNPLQAIDPLGLFCIPWFSEKTPWVERDRESPIYKVNGVFSDLFGPTGFCQWNKIVLIKDERKVRSSQLCFECDNCGEGPCYWRLIQGLERMETRERNDIDNQNTAAIRFYLGNDIEAGDIWTCNNPWTGRAAAFPVQ